MKFILMGLIKSFTKEMGRSPNIGELNLLRREADIIQKQDTIIPFPQGGKDKISPFTPRPKEGEISVTIEGKTQNMTPEGIMDTLMNNEKKLTPIEAMKEANSLIGRKGRYKNISESDAKKKLGELEDIIKSEKLEPEDLVGDDLGDKLKDYDGDPDAMAMGGLAGAIAKLKKKYGKDIIQKGKAPKKSKKKETQDMFREFNRKNKAGGGLAYMLGEPRDGLKEGGPPNPGRRNFMKLMAGLASIPVLGKFFKPAAKVAKVVPLTNTSTTMPAWFPKFVDKAIDKGVGTKIDADIMKYETKELPGVKIQKHDDGRVLVEGSNEYGRPYAIEYEPPGFEVVNEKTGKAVRTKGDFRATDSVPEASGPEDVPDFFPEQLDEVDDILGSDVRVMEEFAKGKKIKEMKRGELNVGQAEARADAARKGEDFATGGLAKLLGE